MLNVSKQALIVCRCHLLEGIKSQPTENLSEHNTTQQIFIARRKFLS
jgi:hypothetical protein